MRGTMRCAPNSAEYKERHENHEVKPTSRHLAAEERAAVQKLLTFVADFLETPTHSGELHPRCGFTPFTGGGRRRHLPLGLHTDTNRREKRFATGIVYLATFPPECDGCTVFPCARKGKAPARELPSARELLAAGCHHTLACGGASAASQALHRAATEHTGIDLAPVAGRLCIFFSRDHNGRVEPASFHGGAAVTCSPPPREDGLPRGKWTMQIFKEVPRDAGCSDEEYAAQRWRAITLAHKRNRKC